MENNSRSTVERLRLDKVGTWGRLAILVALLALFVGTYAYLGGWLTPNYLTPGRFTDGFEEVNGVHEGFRRNHAKGVGVSGFFESNGNGVRLSKAVVFQSGRVPVIGRFSLGGGNPYEPDTLQAVRGLGLQFSPPDGDPWRTAMINIPVFPFQTPEAFYEQLIASKPDPATGKPDPAKMQAFLAKHPQTAAALKIIQAQPVSSGFSDSTFHGLNAFRFTNAAGETVPVRWVLKPEQPFAVADAASPLSDKNALFDALIAKVHQQPLRWRLIIIVGQPGDSTIDPTIPWPTEREQVDVGTLTLDVVEAEETSPATAVTFDPLVLPRGISPSDDPFPSARSAIYMRSLTRRDGETRQPSAITPADIQKGK